MLTICVIDLVLSGDNAVVIALASRNLPPKQRKLAILGGSAAAIILRVCLTIIAVLLLSIPFLHAIGGILLVWIGIKLLTSEVPEEDQASSRNMITAIKAIVIADLIMSLDNVLAVAAASKGNLPLLIIGLFISISITIVGSQLLVYIMNRFPAFVYIGAGLIAWTAGEMINRDNRIAPLIYNYSGHLDELVKMFNLKTVAELEAMGIPHSIMNVPASLEWLLPTAVTLFVCGFGWRIRSKRAAANN